MTLPIIDHIGILVPNLEEGIERWSAATGYSFSPIARYRAHRYCDQSESGERFHEARISFSKEGPPRIELMEVTGNGTHGMAQAGVHHLGFQGVCDAAERLVQLASLGIQTDGVALNDADEILLCFTRKEDLDGIRLELVSPARGNVVADDGSEMWRDPDTGRVSFWGPPTA